jgi:hypothetical protein
MLIDSKNDQLLVRQFLWKTKYTNLEGGFNKTVFVKNWKYQLGGRFKVKIHIFIEITHEPFHSEKLSMV